jgi:hypothetical protein
MYHRFFRVALFGILPAVLVFGQTQGGWSGPLQGFVFDPPTGSVRPIIGIFGAAYVGSAVLSGFDSAWIAPRQQHGIAVKDGQAMLLSGLRSNNPSSSILDGAFAAPEGVRWSGDGSTAILYSAGGAWLQTFTHLPDAPAPDSYIDLSALGGTISAIASDATAQRIAIGIRADTGGGVYVAFNGQSPVLQLPMTNPVALAFSVKTGSLYAADGTSNQVFELQNSGAYSAVLTKDNGANDPVAVQLGEDSEGSRLYLASRGDQALRVYDAKSYNLVAEIALDMPPKGLEQVGDSSYLLAGRTSPGDAFWFLSGKPSATVFFVPAPAEGGGGQQ